MNVKKPVLSVIIPMYNCAPVITRCLDSIDYPDAEIIVVNDGSTDNSADVVRDYKQRLKIEDWRLKIVSKENGGVSSARNLGIQEAKGKYIAFIDADDFWFPNGISRIVELAEQEDADIVKYHIRPVKNGQPLPHINLAHYDIDAEIIEGRGEVLKRYDISDYHVVDAVFKRSIILDNTIRFQTDLHLREDDVFMGMFYCYASKVISTNLPLYCYILSSDFSSTHRQSVEKQRALINSGWKAATYRSQYVGMYYPEAMPMERLKYMRWVCQPKQAIAAQLSLEEYNAVLNRFRSLGAYPLDYRWINVAHRYKSSYKKLKYAVKTFLTNHPRLAYRLLEKR